MTPKQADRIARTLWSTLPHAGRMPPDFRVAVAVIAEEIAQEVRERAAKVAEHFAMNHEFFDSGYDVGSKIAAAIRARRQQETMPV